jgi:septum formation protein
MASFWLQDFNNSNTKLILASASPRRRELMTLAGFDYDIEVRPTDESFPLDMSPHLVASHVAKLKAMAFINDDLSNKIILTADTTVVLGNTVLNKPYDRAHALQMLSELSGKTHTVVTAYCLLSKNGLIEGVDTSEVTLAELNEAELNYYLDRCAPMDKAGSYGIQDWMGVAGVGQITGSYCTVMGLPTHLIYQELKKWWLQKND